MKISKNKMLRSWAMPLCAVVAALFFALPAIAQDDRGRDRDRDDRREKDYRRDKDARDRERDLERERWKQKFDIEDYLKKLDNDKSGVLDGKEIGGERTRQFLEKLGINTSGPVKIDAAVRKAKASYADKRNAERKKFEDQVGPKLNTFGVEQETMGLDGFGVSDNEEPSVATFDDSLTGLKMTDFDEKTLNDARKMLNGYDRDKSGFLEGDEISRVRWKDPKPSQSDLNSDGRISLLEMAKRLEDKSAARAAKSDRDDDRRDRDYDRKDRDYDRKDRADDRRDRDSDRNRRPDKGSFSRIESNRSPTVSSTGIRATGSRSTGSAGGDGAFTNYIAGVYKKYDTDGDDRLSPDELKKMRRPLKGDANRDGFLSKDEAISYIKGDKDKKNGSSNASASKDRNGSSGGPANVASRQYTPPKSSGSRNSGSRSGSSSGGSLGSLDKNSDGQIQMAEFSSTWDEETLQKFRKADKDDNGIITADEWASRDK